MQGCCTPPPPMVSPALLVKWVVVLFGLVAFPVFLGGLVWPRPLPPCGVGPVGWPPRLWGAECSTEVWYGCCRLLAVTSSLRARYHTKYDVALFSLQTAPCQLGSFSIVLPVWFAWVRSGPLPAGAGRRPGAGGPPGRGGGIPLGGGGGVLARDPRACMRLSLVHLQCIVDACGDYSSVLQVLCPHIAFLVSADSRRFGSCSLCYLFQAAGMLHVETCCPLFCCSLAQQLRAS